MTLVIHRRHPLPLHLEALASFHVVWGALFADKLEEQIANQAAGLTIFQTFCNNTARRSLLNQLKHPWSMESEA